MARKSPTRHCLALLKKEGWAAYQVVEKWNAFAKPFGRRIDLFGIIDVLAVKPGVILGIQASTGGDTSPHIKKAMQEPRLWDWLEAGGQFEIWGWRKLGKRGKRKLWTRRRVVFRLIRGGVVYHEESVRSSGDH